MLTPRQQRLLRYIEEYSMQHGISPTYQEMLEHTGLKSKGAVHLMTTKLVERGFLIRSAGRTRSLKLIRPLSVPLPRVYAMGFRAGYAAALRRGSGNDDANQGARDGAGHPGQEVQGHGLRNEVGTMESAGKI
jgi:SOS-response transcriptional repressor LexA